MGYSLCDGGEPINENEKSKFKAIALQTTLLLAIAFVLATGGPIVAEAIKSAEQGNGDHPSGQVSPLPTQEIPSQ